MEVKIGIDLVKIEKLNNAALEKLFNKTELEQNPRKESLAGIFAAKEAFFKALGRKEDWLQVWVEKSKSGEPKMFSTLVDSKNKIHKIHLSISHEDDLAIAIVIIE